MAGIVKEIGYRQVYDILQSRKPRALDADLWVFRFSAAGPRGGYSRHGEFLSLKELHRLPPLPQDQTSARLRYLTATTNAAQRLRAVGLAGHSSASVFAERSHRLPSGTRKHEYANWLEIGRAKCHTSRLRLR